MYLLLSIHFIALYSILYSSSSLLTKNKVISSKQYICIIHCVQYYFPSKSGIHGKIISTSI